MVIDGLRLRELGYVDLRRVRFASNAAAVTIKSPVLGDDMRPPVVGGWGLRRLP